MSSTPDNARHYPAACPKCAEEKGYPYQVRTTGEHNEIEVKLRCRDCRHEWTEVVPSRD
jgi:DNA-directed RNA polymerase subunit M/transcription elongation factor TFIIS